MLAKRIIPCLDIDRGRVVKGVNFVNLIDAGDPVEIAKAYDKIGADEIVFLDITASSDGRETAVDILSRASEQVFIPLTVGGGIRRVEDFRRLLAAGADKIAVNSAAIRDPSLIGEAARRFGSQCVVLAVDAKRSGSGLWEVYLNGGPREHGAGRRSSWIRRRGRAGRGGGAAHLHGPRRHEGGVRPRTDASGGGGGQRARHRVGRGGLVCRTLPTCSPRASADAALAASLFHFGGDWTWGS